MRMHTTLSLCLVLLTFAACGQGDPATTATPASSASAAGEHDRQSERAARLDRVEPERPERFSDAPATEQVSLSDDEWHQRLTPLEFHVLREQGTERPFTGRFHDHHDEGVYRCAGCGAPLYASGDKFESGTGWPSYTRAVEEGRVRELADNAFGWSRTELRCARCDGHLGHVFSDGPPPTGRRHCINSASLDFEPVSEPR